MKVIQLNYAIISVHLCSTPFSMHNLNDFITTLFYFRNGIVSGKMNAPLIECCTVGDATKINNIQKFLLDLRKQRKKENAGLNNEFARMITV